MVCPDPWCSKVGVGSSATQHAKGLVFERPSAAALEREVAFLQSSFVVKLEP